MSDKPIDYYATLSISPAATQQEIRDAYKKAALKSHPDRVPSDSPERPARTKEFQRINDAYYTLSDPSRRRDYDTARTFHFDSSGSSTFGDNGEAADGEIPRTNAAAGGGFPWSAFSFPFGGGGGGGGGGSNSRGATQDPSAPDAGSDQESFNNEQFGSVFEEMLRDEGLAEGQDARPTSKFWSVVGGLSGGAMGFILANFPGALAGAVAGNRLGAVRDARGKSVYAVFQELPQADKARLLSQLAGRVFATVASGV